MPEYNGRNYRYEYNDTAITPNANGFFINLDTCQDFLADCQYIAESEKATWLESAKYLESFGYVHRGFRGRFTKDIEARRVYNGVYFDGNRRIQAFRDSLRLHYRWDQACYMALNLTSPDVSESNPELWAYYQNAEKRALAGVDGKGIKTLIKYGKLLKKLFPMATDDQISAEVEAWKESVERGKEPMQFHIATDSASFAHAYAGEQAPTLNPNLGWPYKSLACSCMRHEESEWAARKHPARAYASGDFAIVYATKGGKIAARAVVPFNKASEDDESLPKLCGISAPIYTTSNSASEGLRAFIESNGAAFSDDSYQVAKDWIKRHLTMAKIEYRGYGILMPYVDCINSGSDNGDSIVLDDEGPISCRETRGWAELRGQYTCDECGDSMDEDEARHTDSGSCLCDSCYTDQYFYCDQSNSECLIEDSTVVYLRRGFYVGYVTERVSDDWRDDHCQICQDDNEYWHSDLIHWIEGDAYSPRFDGYGQCLIDGELYLAENLSYVESVSDYIETAKLESDPAWTQVNGQWQLAEGWQFTDRYYTSWELIEFEDVDSDIIKEEFNDNTGIALIAAE